MADIQKNNSKRGFLSRTKFYIFEYTSLQVANFCLAIGFSVAIFSFFSILSGNTVSSDTIEGFAWVLGSTLVFAPTVILLYARTSGEELKNPARLHQPLRKVVFYFILTIAIISAMSFLITSVYTASRVLFGLADTKSLLTTSAPSLLVLLLHTYFIGFVIRGTSTSPKLRKINIVTITALCSILALIIIVISLVNGDSISADKNIVKDFKATSAAINNEYRLTGELPNSISELGALSNQDIKDKFNSGEYKYQRNIINQGYDLPAELNSEPSESLLIAPSPDFAIGSYGDYKLCATFKTSSNHYETYDSSYGYGSSSLLGSHPKGYHCFDLYTY